MNLSKRQTEFWAVLLLICLVVSTAILLVDFQIKQAILEESNRLRLAIEEWEVRQSGRRKAQDRTNTNPGKLHPISGHVLVDAATRMETENVPNGVEKPTPKNTGRRRNEPRRPSGNTEIPSGDK